MRRNARRSIRQVPVTHQELVDTAAALFREKGYAATSTRELAYELGIQHASLYHHVARKEDLLYAVCVEALRHIHMDVEAAVSSSDQTALERLRALIRAHLVAALEDQNKHGTMLFELRAFSEERRAEIMQLRDAYELLVERTVRDAQRVGAIRRDIKARFLTLALLNLLNWTIFWFKPDKTLSAGQIAELLATLFLDGACESNLQPDQRLPRRPRSVPKSRRGSI